MLAAVARGAAAPAEKYDVLIAEFRLPDSPSFAEINAADPGISVIDVDLERGTSNTPMFDVGSERLRRLAEWRTREAGLTSLHQACPAPPETGNRRPSVTLIFIVHSPFADSGLRWSRWRYGRPTGIGCTPQATKQPLELSWGDADLSFEDRWQPGQPA